MRFILFIHDIYYLLYIYIYTDIYIYIYTFMYFFKVQTMHVSTKLSQQLQHGQRCSRSQDEMEDMEGVLRFGRAATHAARDILSWIKT